MSGHTLDFSEDMLRAAVEGYDPELHEAPIVVGHPKDNHPAYGWVKSLQFGEDGMISVEPHQVDPEFSEMVEAGRFKKRSASWYLPDAPNNPKPGTLYLRHVGFLGAQPPAIKGLKDVAFSEEEGAVTVEFADRYTWGTLAGIFRNLREWFISEKDLETADRLVPAYALSELESASNQPDPEPQSASPAFAEDETMDIETLKARVAELQEENETLKTQNAKHADFAERESALESREQAIAQREQVAAKAAVEARVDAAIQAGKALPAQKGNLVDFAMGLADAEATIEFGEGDKAEKITQREAYLRQIEAAPKLVDYSEHSHDTGAKPSDDAADPAKVADRARQLHIEAGKNGKAISFSEAVAQATAEFNAD